MSIVLARRLRAFHALLEMALRDERARSHPDDHTVSRIKKRKLAIKDRLSRFDSPRTSSAAH